MSFVYAPYGPMIVTRITLSLDFDYPSRVGQIWMLTSEAAPYMVIKSYKNPFKKRTIFHNVESIVDGSKRVWKENPMWSWDRDRQHKRVI